MQAHAPESCTCPFLGTHSESLVSESDMASIVVRRLEGSVCSRCHIDLFESS